MTKRHRESDAPPPVKQRVVGMVCTIKGKLRIWDGNRWLCEHKRKQSSCRECKGAGICDCGKQKQTCRRCDGSGFCEPHDRLLATCKECKGGSVCDHKRMWSSCKECKGGGICDHGELRYRCKPCGGSLYCKPHGKIWYYCKLCGGSQICIHEKQRETCKYCDGSRVCRNCKISQTNRYRPYCAPCYYHLNPDVPCTRNYLTKQRFLNDWLKLEIDQPAVYDSKVQGGCSARRLDWRWECLTHTVGLENDENQHVSTQCEDKRTMEIFQDLGNRPLVLIRFNPDSYRDSENERIKGCFELDEKNKLEVVSDEWERRTKALKPVLLRALTTIPGKEVTVKYLFYNEVDVSDDEEEDEEEEEEEKEQQPPPPPPPRPVVSASDLRFLKLASELRVCDYPYVVEKRRLISVYSMSSPSSSSSSLGGAGTRPCKMRRL